MSTAADRHGENIRRLPFRDGGRAAGLSTSLAGLELFFDGVHRLSALLICVGEDGHSDLAVLSAGAMS